MIYFLVINFTSLYLMYADKQKARKKAWRIPESNLFFLCLAGGFMGTFLGMKYFHHKTKQWQFHLAVIVSAFCWLLFFPSLYYYLVVQP